MRQPCIFDHLGQKRNAICCGTFRHVVSTSIVNQDVQWSLLLPVCCGKGSDTCRIVQHQLRPYFNVSMWEFLPAVLTILFSDSLMIRLRHRMCTSHEEWSHFSYAQIYVCITCNNTRWIVLHLISRIVACPLCKSLTARTTHAPCPASCFATSLHGCHFVGSGCLSCETVSFYRLDLPHTCQCPKCYLSP